MQYLQPVNAAYNITYTNKTRFICMRVQVTDHGSESIILLCSRALCERNEHDNRNYVPMIYCAYLFAASISVSSYSILVPTISSTSLSIGLPSS